MFPRQDGKQLQAARGPPGFCLRWPCSVQSLYRAGPQGEARRLGRTWGKLEVTAKGRGPAEQGVEAVPAGDL